MSVVDGVRLFDSYLYGRHFTIYLDHKPLTYVFSKKNKSPRMTCYAHDPTFYSFKIMYKEGPTDHVPDLLMRQIAQAKVLPDDESPVHLAALADLRRYLLKFEVKDGVLHRLKHLPDRVNYQLVVPDSLRNSALSFPSRCSKDT